MNSNAQTNANANAQTEAPADADKVKLSIPKRVQHFTADNLEAAQDAVDHIMTLSKQLSFPVFQNFDDDDEVPDGYGLMLKLVTPRGTTDEVTCGIIMLVPSLDQAFDSDLGNKWLMDTMVQSIAKQATYAIVGRGDVVNKGVRLPLKVDEFFITGRSESLTGFNELAADYCAALREQGATGLDKKMLRGIFESKAYAEAEYPKVQQEQWVTIINSMKKKAAKAGYNTQIFDHWLDTRDSVEIVEKQLGELDLSALEDL